ncbi:MAG: M20 family metallopeptidase [Gemmatimonadales bacterium]|jgi:amidohydrolase
MMTTLQKAIAVALFAMLAAGSSGPAARAQDPSLVKHIERHLQGVREDLIEVRRDIHRHPEVSGQERRTAAIVAERLSALGLEVRTGIGGHGVVGILEGGQPGGVVAYRADMDAVYSNAPDPVPFASQNPDVRHICGHDIHTTVALGIAEGLASIRAELPGTVVFIFQPAEENIQGAKAMIEAGALDDPTPTAIFAVHSAPLEVGQIGSVEGLALPGLDRVSVTVRGTGDLEAAARAYARTIAGSSTGDAVAPEGYISAMVGSPRPLPENGEWAVTGMVRAGSPEAGARARQAIERGLADIDIQGVSYELLYQDQVLPDMVNDPGLVRSTLSAIRSVVGTENLIEINRVTPYFGEDFAFFQQLVPGAMYWLGVSSAELGYVGMPHSPDFVADEGAIFIGATAMAAVLLDFLEKN